MNSATSSRKIGFLGLGLMGRPMSLNLLKAGHQVTVWNRTAARASDLVAAGATLAKTPREAAAAADILISIVSDPPALEEILWGHEGKDDGALAGLKPGSIYIDSSTISPVLARRIAEYPSNGLVLFVSHDAAFIGTCRAEILQIRALLREPAETRT